MVKVKRGNGGMAVDVITGCSGAYISILTYSNIDFFLFWTVSKFFISRFVVLLCLIIICPYRHKKARNLSIRAMRWLGAFALPTLCLVSWRFSLAVQGWRIFARNLRFCALTSFVLRSSRGLLSIEGPCRGFKRTVVTISQGHKYT